MEVPQKTKDRVTIGSSNPTPGHISRENHTLKRYMHPDVHCSSIYNSQDMEATQMSIDRGMDKENVVHINSGILLSHKKNETLPSEATWMDLEIIILREVGQVEKDKYYMASLTYGI